MIKAEFLLELDEVLDLPPGTVKGPEKLADVNWSSIAMIGFIALADKNNETILSPRQIVKCSTVDDLLRIAGVEGVSG